ncbi:MAG: lytic transglycosylase domain-containing protein [Gammaproteobacteria bacterium]|nr:lytic transglycosylase domain-containing protein [Gammaproteobacteria bacterium]
MLGPASTIRFRLASLILVLCGLGAPQAWAQQGIDDPDPELRRQLIAAVTAADSFEDRFDAEVWLLDMSQRLRRFMPEREQRLEFLRLVHAEATRAKVSPEIVLAVIEVESHFERFALSVAGAQGYMQVMPFWIEEIGRPEDNLFLAATNLRYGCTILKFYLDRENGNLVNALARYNGSYGRPQYPYKVLEALNRRWYQG